MIPCHLLTTHTLPSAALLEPYPRLQKLFSPLARCIKLGDLAGFDTALAHGEEEFVRRRIYLTLERGRDIAIRNLFRKVFLNGGFIGEDETKTRRTRIPISEFEGAITMSMDVNRLTAKNNGKAGKIGANGASKSRSTPDRDEVECLLANMIYKV